MGECVLYIGVCIHVCTCVHCVVYVWVVGCAFYVGVCMNVCTCVCIICGYMCEWMNVHCV